MKFNLFSGYSYSEEQRLKRIREQLMFEWRTEVIGNNEGKKEAY
jgi:hypothetical protein